MAKRQYGPIYGVPLIREMSLGDGVMLQAMPSLEDLVAVQKKSERTVAGYEVLLSGYMELLDVLKAASGDVIPNGRLRKMIDDVLSKHEGTK